MLRWRAVPVRFVYVASTALLCLVTGCAAVNQGNVHAHGGPAGGDWEGHVTTTVAKAPRDSDGDGVPDRKDNCPKEAGVPEHKGCAQAQSVAIGDGKLDITELVFFETGKDAIDPRSNALLDQIAAVLNGHDEILKIAVEGHTDDVGDAAFNRELSQKRASAVASYLVGKGVAGARLTAAGFGPDKPIAPNDSDESRAKNRRVEFRIVDARADEP